VGELLQQDVRQFLREAGSVFAEGAGPHVIARVQKARPLIAEVFRVVESIVHQSAEAQGPSFVGNRGERPSDQDRPLAETFPPLGDEEIAWGPWVIGVIHRIEERLHQHLSSERYRSQVRDLCGLLQGITNELPEHRLGRVARDLLKLLRQAPDEARDHELVSWHESSATFCSVLPQCAAHVACGDAEDQQRWHKNLAGGARSLLGDCEYYPVEGAYEEVPFVLMRRARHEVDRDCSVFRDGLCVSRDLNLVNALLLTETWAEDLLPPTRGIATST
jgi:hypothetical protein